MTSKEEVLRAGTYAADFVVFEERAAFVVDGINLADFEEIEGFPLRCVNFLAILGNTGILPKSKPFR
jgi:hypothetical protein